MFTEIDWQTIVEQFVHIGLIFGAIFQLICIGAAIFLPCKSELATNQRESSKTSSSFESGTNERFLDESDDDQDLNVGKIYGNRHGNSNNHVHHRHHHQMDDNRSNSRGSSSSSSWNSRNKEGKRKRR
ncbi:uncharacterized protein LOC124494273 [Dermatophagoides farinae]|uniref:Uncharacterized protein n=1 Tax=Dermatophagoides farinae TaxID=6954 RepID=A0A922I065_DERFA|nr:probable serine/threonine-protein kinase DDB_G0282963 [Dermatophagoides farinae]KAH9517353.1 hypothetical protein DERF_008031 [Dermatophagoides farinae]